MVRYIGGRLKFMKQERRFSEDEINLIKATFKDNDTLLKSLRKFVLQLDLSEKDELTLRNQLKGDTFKVVKKCFLPEIDGDAPIMQTVDMWLTLNFGDRNPDLALLHIRSRARLIEYFDKMMDDLEGIEVKPIEFEELINLEGTPEDVYVNLLARNTIVMHVEQQLNQLNVLANELSETPEQLSSKAIKNSTK